MFQSVGPYPGAGQLVGGATLPSSPTARQVFMKTSGGSEGMYICISDGSWVLLEAASGAGTVTSVSVVSANGFSASVANPTTTPAITINNPTALVATTSVATPQITLGTVSSVTGSLKLANASTANLTTLQAGNAASALTFVWPIVNPTSGQALLASAPSGSTVTLSWGAAGISNSAGNTIIPVTSGASGNLVASALTDNATNILSTEPIAVGFGATTPPSGPMLMVASTASTSPRGILSAQFSTDTSGARVGFQKARGSVASPTTVVTGDTLGRLMFRGYDGTSYLEMGSIEVAATGTIGTNRVPTQLVFSTATDAATSVLTTALTIGADQSATFVSSSAAAAAFGPNGNTNPVLRVVNSTVSQADGISITGGAAGTGTTIAGLSSGSNSPIIIAGKGTSGVTIGSSSQSGVNTLSLVSTNGTANFNVGGSAVVSLDKSFVVNGSTFTLQPGGGNTTILLAAAAANLQLGAAAVDLSANVVAQKLSVQNVLTGGTSDQAGKDFTIAGSQGKGTGAGGSIIFQTAPAGSTGTSVNALATVLTLASTGSVAVTKTITASTSTGDKTINKTAGSIRIAATGTSVVLTNSLIDANSIVLATISTNDTTSKSVQAVPTSGSVTFYLNAAATAEVEIRWLVIN